MAYRRWARTLSAVLAVVLWLCLGLVMPIVVGLYSSDSAIDSVEAAPSDGFVLSRPLVDGIRDRLDLYFGTA